MSGIRGHYGLMLGGSAPVSNNYTTLLNFDAADASTTFTDDTGLRTWSAGGNAQIDTAQSKFGGSSLLLDGSGDFISTASSADFVPGTGDFGFACWIRPTSSLSSFRELLMANVNGGLNILLIDGRLTVARENVTNLVQATVGDAITALDTWHHIEVNRNGSALRGYVNGTQVITLGTTEGFVQGAVTIGAKSGGTSAFNGWIDSLVWKKGGALHGLVTSFTPPTSAYTP